MKLETKYFIKDDDGNIVNEFCFLEKPKGASFYYAKKEEHGKYVLLNLNYEEISKYRYINFEFYKFPDCMSAYSIFAIGVVLKPNKHKRYVILNSRGEKIVHEEFSYAIFGEIYKSVIVRRGKKFGVIDDEGKEIIPFEYDSISYIEELGYNLFEVSLKGRKKVIFV